MRLYGPVRHIEVGDDLYRDGRNPLQNKEPAPASDCQCTSSSQPAKGEPIKSKCGGGLASQQGSFRRSSSK
jgi:hypothetical protein